MDFKFRFNLRITQKERPELWYVEEKSIREWVAYPKSRTQSRQYRITYGTSNYERRWVLFQRFGAIWPRGISCEATQDSHGCSVLYTRNHSYEGKKVKGYSFLSIHQRELSFNRNLEVGHVIDTSLWSRWARLTEQFMWIRCVRNCWRHFKNKGARKFSDKEWLQHLYERSNKTKFE